MYLPYCIWKALPAIAPVLCCTPELAKTPFMKILHDCVIEHGEIKYMLLKKLHSYCLAFTLLEVLCIVLEEKSNQQSYQAINSIKTHNNQLGKI